MDHPLVSPEQSDLRKRVVQLLRNSYKAHRSSNIVFVCGGNDSADMRMRFRGYCADNLEEFEIFLPEYAFENIFTTESDDQFDITDFEELISELSHAVVVFPEAPGSFAETGYFSAIDEIAKRCILVLDAQHQKCDSFISLGPAKKIGSSSVFHPIIQMDYKSPDFDLVSERIRRIDPKKTKKAMKYGEFKQHNTYEISCIIHGIVNILSIDTIDDVCYLFSSIFMNRYSKNKVKYLISILVGAGHLKRIGEYGHVFVEPNRPKLLELRGGYVKEETSIRLSLAEIYQQSDTDFRDLVTESRDAN